MIPRQQRDANMSDDKTKVTRHLQMPTDTSPMPPRATGPLDNIMPWVIEFRVMGTAYIIQVPASEAILVGRSDPRRELIPDVDLTPYAAHVLGVSRQHARISVKKDRVTVEDLESANGTFLNGHVLKSGEEVRMRHGDQLSFGQLHLQVQFVVTPSGAGEASETGEPGKQTETLEVPIVGQGRRILVIDDDVDVAKLIASIFERAGFQVTTVMNGVNALSLMAEKMPDAIVFELVLPDMDGVDLVRYVRKDEKGKDVPMIAISSATGGYIMKQATEAGVDVVLSKPVGVTEIVKALEAIVE
jgi:CheY-like chemotaxis protein